MRLQIEPTGKVVSIDGVLCRAWHGVNEQGVNCVVFVHRIMLPADADSSEFDAELLAGEKPDTVEEVGMRQDWG